MLMFAGLTDLLFGAPGEWSLHRCRGCKAAYLDPRLTTQAIGIAYGRYYTHEDAPPPAGPEAAPPAGVKAWVRNGYLAWRYGLPLTPAWEAVGRLVPLLPRHRIAFDTSVRHLALPRRGAKLLDVGCGSGEFLARARALGWTPTGLEVDPVAAGRARTLGFEVVEAPLSSAELPAGSFDAITMNHVLEHLHHPIEALEEAHRLLRPGGWLWLATPNLGSPLMRALGPSWRGFEPPRHLVLFSRETLRSAVRSAGYTDLRWPNAYPLTRWMLDASPADPGVRAAVARRRLRLRLIELATLFSQRWSEQLVVMARRPEEGA